jgi:hypothetical protein
MPLSIAQDFPNRFFVTADGHRGMGYDINTEGRTVVSPDLGGTVADLTNDRLMAMGADTTSTEEQSRLVHVDLCAPAVDITDDTEAALGQALSMIAATVKLDCQALFDQ